MSNYQSSFHVIDLKLDIEPSLLYCRRSARIATSSAAACCSHRHAARCAVERSDEYLCTGGRRGLPQKYTKVSKQAGAFRDHSTFRTCFKKSDSASVVFGNLCVNNRKNVFIAAEVRWQNHVPPFHLDTVYVNYT